MDRQLYDEIHNFLNSGKIPTRCVTTAEKRSFQNYTKPFQLYENKLVRLTKWKQQVSVLKQGETEAILYLYHNDPISGHFGKKKVFDKVRQNYYWPQMYKEIEEYIDSCYFCQTRASPKKNNELNPIEPTGPWERVGIDFIGPLEESTQRNRYIITAMDYFTRWPEARAVPYANAETAARFIYEEIICRHGIVNVIHTDQGTHFVNELLKELAGKFQMKHHRVTAYHPQANGLVERFNGTLKKTLSKICEETEEWDKFIAPALFAYRTSKVDTIGVAPSILENGRTLKLPGGSQSNETIWQRVEKMVIDLPIFQENAMKVLKKAQEKMQQNYKVKPTQFQVGDEVLVRKSWLGHMTKTFGPKWNDPLTVSKVYDHGTYQLLNKDGTVTRAINGDRLKLYKRRSNLEPIVVIEPIIVVAQKQL
jgi:Integrase zinc binding domain/Integrase core domain